MRTTKKVKWMVEVSTPTLGLWLFDKAFISRFSCLDWEWYVCQGEKEVGRVTVSLAVTVHLSFRPVSKDINSSPGSYQCGIGSDLQGLGELDWWSSFDRAGAPDVGVERECFFSSLNICGASSLPLPVLLNLSTCTTEPKLLTQRTLSNSIPSSRWLCVCDRVFGLQRKCALWASLSSFSLHFLVDERKMLVYCCWWKFRFCVVLCEPWGNFKGALTCILRVFTD